MTPPGVKLARSHGQLVVTSSQQLWKRRDPGALLCPASAPLLSAQSSKQVPQMMALGSEGGEEPVLPVLPAGASGTVKRETLPCREPMGCARGSPSSSPNWRAMTRPLVFHPRKG